MKQQERLRQILFQNDWLLAIVLIVMIGCSSAAAVINARSTARALRIAEAGRERGQSIKEATDLIKDCVTEGGRCFAEGQRRQAEAVTAIVQAVTDGQLSHRRRNEAENLCSVLAVVEMANQLTSQPGVPLSPEGYQDHYLACVLDKSGGLGPPDPPAVPSYPTGTTTTTRGGTVAP